MRVRRPLPGFEPLLVSHAIVEKAEEAERAEKAEGAEKEETRVETPPTGWLLVCAEAMPMAAMAACAIAAAIVALSA